MFGVTLVGRSGVRHRRWWVGGALLATVALGICAVPSACGQAGTPAEVGQSPPTSQPAQDAQDELARQIEALVRQAQEAGETEPPPAEPEPASQPAEDDDCGKATKRRQLMPPPADQPQPRWACAEPELAAEPCWPGKAVDFVFTLRNEGEGMLDIHLRKP